MRFAGKKLEFKTLGEICDIVSGGTPSRSRMEFWNNGDIPWIKIGNLNGKYVEKADEYITKVGLENSAAKVLPKGTILYTIFATLGETAILSIDACTNQAIAGICIKDNLQVSTDYMYYFLKSKKKFVNNIGRGVAQNNINMSILKAFKVPLPEYSAQSEIVDILDKTVNIINMRRVELEKLDRLVKARFVEMFGDPVRNSKNWNTEKLCSIAPINKYNGDIDKFNGKVWLLNLDMIESRTGNIVDFLYEFENRITSSTIKFDENCVLYSKLRPYLNKVVIPERKGYATSELVSMSTEKINKYFLANLLRQDSFVNFSNATAYGAKMPRASMDLIKNFDVINPPTELQNQFGKLVIEVEKSKVEVQRALDEAQLLFDSLMQKYFG